MKLRLLEPEYTVWKAPDMKVLDIQTLAQGSPSLFSFNTTPDEVSLTLESDSLPDHYDGDLETGWRAFQVAGPLDFSLTGILSSIAEPLAQHKISIFAISTYDTDYVLVKKEDVRKAHDVLSLTFEISDYK